MQRAAATPPAAQLDDSKTDALLPEIRDQLVVLGETSRRVDDAHPLPMWAASRQIETVAKRHTRLGRRRASWCCVGHEVPGRRSLLRDGFLEDFERPVGRLCGRQSRALRAGASRLARATPCRRGASRSRARRLNALPREGRPGRSHGRLTQPSRPDSRRRRERAIAMARRRPGTPGPLASTFACGASLDGRSRGDGGWG